MSTNYFSLEIPAFFIPKDYVPFPIIYRAKTPCTTTNSSSSSETNIF